MDEWTRFTSCTRATYRRLLVDLPWTQVQVRRWASQQRTQVLGLLFPEFRRVFRESVSGPAALQVLGRLPTVAAIAERRLRTSIRAWWGSPGVFG